MYSIPAAASAPTASIPTSASPHLLDATMCWRADGIGAVRRHVLAKRAHLCARGWRHTLLAPGATGEGELDCGGLPLPGTGDCRFVATRARARRLILQAQPDIVEAADPFLLGWSVLEATERLDVPAVAFCHSHLANTLARLIGGPAGADSARGRWAARRARAYLGRFYGHFDLVLAPSRWMVRELHEWGVRHAMHQPLGVERSVFTPAARDLGWRARLQQHLGVAEGTRLLVYAGRFAPEKNLGVLADAVRRLGRDHLLVAVGAGPRPPGGDQVRVLATETDGTRLARLIASCDAFVHAGQAETSGLSALEAMSCGTPVIASASGGLGELVGDGAGVPVHGLRVQAWADAMYATLDGTPPAMIAAGFERAQAHEGSAVVELLARRYAQALHRHARPGRWSARDATVRGDGP